jgi:hypothetical protein
MRHAWVQPLVLTTFFTLITGCGPLEETPSTAAL